MKALLADAEFPLGDHHQTVERHVHAFIDALYNVSRFKADGLPVETAWHTCLNQSFRGFWLDPKSKEFGPNAKYFQHDLAEAKKLLSAAGYASPGAACRC